MSMRKKRTPFDIFEEIRNEMERMWEEEFGENPMCDVAGRELEPLTQVYETEESINIKIDLPSVEKKDIKIQAAENTLKVEAAMKECVRVSCWGPFQRVTEFDSFKKIIRLPAAVDAKLAKARFRNGILEIVLPKKIAGVEIPVE